MMNCCLFVNFSESKKKEVILTHIILNREQLIVSLII